MARDYKRTRTNNSGSMSAWGGFAIGLLVGLAVATAVYLYDRRPGVELRAGAPLSNEQASDGSDTPTPESAKADTQFDFYDVLPKLEVEVANDRNQPASNSSAAGAIDAPGSYTLQVGSYRNFADADRVRARLALQGIESGIQKVVIDSETWHRVRIGPISNLNKLEDTRRKLREAQIDTMVIKQGTNK
ncbi:MAG: SPOR domain-containing protein [Steroidobacteraceae bacterium]